MTSNSLSSHLPTYTVREKAKQLIEMLGDNERIRDERDKARRLRDKFVGIGVTGGMSGISGGLGGAGRYGRCVTVCVSLRHTASQSVTQCCLASLDYISVCLR